MKNCTLLIVLVTLLGAASLGYQPRRAGGSTSNSFHALIQPAPDLQGLSTPVPTDDLTISVVETPEARVLPAVGSNAGLVIGASVLVLIIIGGVLGARRRQNH